MPLRVLISGGSGYLGNSVIDECISLGWTVHALGRPSSQFKATKSPRLRIHLGDFRAKEIAALVRNESIECTIYMASKVLTEHRNEDIGDLIAANILLGTELIQGSIDGGCFNFLNTGTTWQHFHTNDTDRYHPVCLYAATKQAMECIIRYYVEAHSCKCITLKVCDTYGPDDDRPKLLTHLLKAFKSGDPIRLSPGEQKLDMVHVSDVAKAFSIAVEYFENISPGSYHSFRLGSGAPISVKNFVATIESVLQHEFIKEWGARPYKAREVMHPWQGGELLPNWKPQVDFATGIKDVFSRS